MGVQFHVAKLLSCAATAAAFGILLLPYAGSSVTTPSKPIGGQPWQRVEEDTLGRGSGLIVDAKNETADGGLATPARAVARTALPAVQPQDAHHTLMILLRTGANTSAIRRESIKKTWASGLADNQLKVLGGHEGCRQKWGDNHWWGLTCLEANAHTEIMNRTDFSWLLVVDDDTYVVVDRLTNLLDTLDPHRLQAFGAPGCGDCGGGRKGFCGGGGYFLSRQSLLHMAGLSDVSDGHVPPSVSQAFVDHFMKGPDNEWCDVRFACVAQDTGLRLVEQEGMYGNGIEDEKSLSQIIRLKKEKPPLVFHLVRNASYMERIHRMVVEMAAQRPNSMKTFVEPLWPKDTTATSATTTAPTLVDTEEDEEGNPFVDKVADQEGAIYEALYKKKAASTGDELSASVVAALLEESGASTRVLRSVWNAAKKEPNVPHGAKSKMNFKEFVVACKLTVKAGGTFAASSKKPTWKNIPKTTYKCHEDASTWSDAQAQCEREGGTLATISDATENQIVHTNCRNGWFGCRTLDGSNWYVELLLFSVYERARTCACVRMRTFSCVCQHPTKIHNAYTYGVIRTHARAHCAGISRMAVHVLIQIGTRVSQTTMYLPVHMSIRV